MKSVIILVFTATVLWAAMNNVHGKPTSYELAQSGEPNTRIKLLVKTYADVTDSRARLRNIRRRNWLAAQDHRSRRSTDSKKKAKEDKKKRDEQHQRAMEDLAWWEIFG